MYRLLGPLILILLFAGWSGRVSSAPITDTVLVGDKEWAQADLFLNLSWYDISNLCPGRICSGTLNGHSLEGWTWASLADIDLMFNHFLAAAGKSGTDLLSGPDQFTEADSSWAPAFFGAGFRPIQESVSERKISAWTSTTDAYGLGIYAYTFILVDRSEGIADRVITDSNGTKWFGQEHLGAWFYRDAVPSPTPEELIQELIGLVLELNLANGISNSYDAKLDNVLRSLDDSHKNNDVAAINGMWAFINSVEAQRGKELTEEEADSLIDAANAVLESLNEED
jgi:hypothetical protein